jgi:hypothetical protein
MMVEASELAQAIRTTRPMVPAKDFAIIKQFYGDLGFQPRMPTARLCGEDFYSPPHNGNSDNDAGSGKGVLQGR